MKGKMKNSVLRTLTLMLAVATILSSIQGGILAANTCSVGQIGVRQKSTITISKQAPEVEKRLFAEKEWANWNVRYTAGQTARYEIACPERNMSTAATRAMVVDLMKYCSAENPDATTVVVEFGYDEQYYNALGGYDYHEQLRSAIMWYCGVRAVGNGYINVVYLDYVGANNGVVKFNVRIDVNRSNTRSYFSADPYSQEVFDKLEALAASIKSRESNARKQLDLLNSYLVDNVAYGKDARKTSVHSSVGAMLDGEAMCSGYCGVVSDVCYLLGIPSYQLTSKDRGHVWNMVYVDGEWLLLDATFNDSTGNRYNYFLVKSSTLKEHAYDKAENDALRADAERLYSISR